MIHLINLLEELEESDSSIVTEKQLDKIKCHELVEKVMFNGINVINGNLKWYSIYLFSGEEYQVYSA